MHKLRAFKKYVAPLFQKKDSLNRGRDICEVIIRIALKYVIYTIIYKVKI